MVSVAEAAAPLRIRRVVASVLGWLLAVTAAVPLFGLIDLGTIVGLSDPAYRWSMSLEASWGALFAFVVAVAGAAVAVAPRRPWPGVALLALAALALAAGAAVLADTSPLWIAVPLALVAVCLGWLLLPYLAPSRPRWRPRPSPLAVAAAVGVPLWLGYTVFTVRSAMEAAPGSGDETVGIDHWPVQVALGLTLAAGSAVLVGAGRSLTLWRWSFGACAVAVAWATLAYPDRAGAMPHPVWGVLILVWAAALALPAGGRSDRRAVTR